MEKIENNNALVFDRDLAAKIGLNEAIVIHQIEFWLDKYKDDEAHIHDGKVWVFNTYEQWQKQFPFWSVRTIKSIFKNFIENKILITGRYNKLKIDRTCWYSINSEALNLNTNNDSIESASPIVQNLHNGKCNNCTMESAEIAPPIPNITTNNTTEKTDLKVSLSDKNESDDELDMFIKKSLPIMVTRAKLLSGLTMPLQTIISLIERFLHARVYYSTLEYKLTQKSPNASLIDMVDFIREVEGNVTEDCLHEMMEKFFDNKESDPKTVLYSWNYFCNKKMLQGLYCSVTDDWSYSPLAL